MKEFSMQLLFSIILATAFIFLFMPISRSQDSYIDEFNNSGENVTIDSSWTYYTANGQNHQVDVYKYCVSDCMLVLFDKQNIQTLNSSQAYSFFQNYQLKQYVDSGIITTNLYSINYKESFTCNLLAPTFGEEATNAVIQTTIDKISPKVLPEYAESVVETIYQAGKDVGIVKSTDVPVLILGASCIVGTNFLESAAKSTLTSCQDYVHDLQIYHAYEGESNDLLNCHNDSISKLTTTLSDPNVIFQHLEVQTSNGVNQVVYDIKSGTCTYLKIGCGGSSPIADNSTYQELTNQIQLLKQSFPDVGSINIQATMLSGQSADRISQKYRESQMAIGTLDEKIIDVQMKMNNYKILDYDIAPILNIFLSPSYDFSLTSSNLTMANQNLYYSTILQTQYRYNSASAVAINGLPYADAALQNFTQEESKQRTPQILPIIVVAIIIILFFYSRRKPKPQTYYSI